MGHEERENWTASRYVNPQQGTGVEVRDAQANDKTMYKRLEVLWACFTYRDLLPGTKAHSQTVFISGCVPGFKRYSVSRHAISMPLQ